MMERCNNQETLCMVEIMLEDSKFRKNLFAAMEMTRLESPELFRRMCAARITSTWCFCGSCRPMRRPEEAKCCRSQMGKCIALDPVK